MKVLLLAPTPPPAGGIASWTVRMMSAELKDGWKVVVVDEKIDEHRKAYSTINLRYLFNEIKRSRRIWNDLKTNLKNDNDIKVVQSCIPSATFSMIREYVCAHITKKYNRKFIIHFRCTVPNTTNSKIGKFILKKLCKKCDSIIALNDETVKYLEKITRTLIVLIPNFINKNEMMENKVTNKHIKKVIYTGNVLKTKGCLDIIETAKSFPDIEFKLVGAVEDEIRFIAEKNDNITLTGSINRDEVEIELQNADVFMFLTYFPGEGFSNSLAEAMAKGLPCIVTDWAANRDMIENKGGVVIPIKDPQAAIEALKSIFPLETRIAQSEFNINKVREKYIDEVVQAKYVDLYNNLVDNK